MDSNQGVDGATLAALFDVDEQSIRRLARRRIVVRTGHGRYALGPSIKAYITHLRAEAEKRLGSDPAIDPVRETAELSRAKAQWFRLTNAKLESTIVSRADLPRAWRMIVETIRGIPPKVLAGVRRDLPHLSAYDLATLEGVMKEQLDDAGLADDPPAAFD